MGSFAGLKTHAMKIALARGVGQEVTITVGATATKIQAGVGEEQQNYEVEPFNPDAGKIFERRISVLLSDLDGIIPVRGTKVTVAPRTYYVQNGQPEPDGVYADIWLRRKEELS